MSAHSQRTEDKTGVGADKRRLAWLRSPFVFGILVIAGLVFLATKLHSTEDTLITTYRHFSWGRLPWLVVALGSEAISFVCYAGVQRFLLRSGGARLTRRTMVALAVGATGLTNLVPGGTAPASGWLVQQYRRREVPLPLALWAVIANGYAAAVSILLLLLAGAGVAGLLNPLELIGCAVALAGGATAFVWASHNLAALARWLKGRGANRGLRLIQRLTESTAGVAGYRTTVRGGALVLALSLANWAMDVFVLISAFGVLGLAIPWRAVLFAYATAQVAGSLAPVPGGIGFVEGGMIGAFALAGSGLGGAILATIVYRAITCWLVAAVGSLVLLGLSRISTAAPALLDGHTPGVPGSPPADR